MNPNCQFCGASDPVWYLRRRDADVNGPEICDACVARLGRKQNIWSKRWDQLRAHRTF